MQRWFVRQVSVTMPLLWAVALAVASGCAAKPYRYGSDLHTSRDASLAAGEPQMERGRRAPVVDAVGWVVGIPAKIVLLNHRASNHDVSPETEAALQNYLASNDLGKVKVRVNQYNPGGEWQRLNENKSVAWPVRYTFGTLSLVGYTLLPGRIFGGDDYNPYTNTINVYSDIPAMALYEGGAAKDYAQTDHKALYAIVNGLPVVGIWHQRQALDDATGYLQENGTAQEIKDGYRTLYPVYAMKAGGSLEVLTGPGVILPALAAGHVIGQVKAVSVPKDEPLETRGLKNQAAPQPATTAQADTAPIHATSLRR